MELLSRYPSAKIVGLDILNDYYDPKLKDYRLEEIEKINDGRITFVKGNLADKELITKLFETHNFDVVVNLAA